LPDSRVINRRISQIVWPELRRHGFETSGRSAWRSSRGKTDVVTFWALGNYAAGVYRTTPFSFKVQLGIWLPYVVAWDTTDEANGEPQRPDESACPLRRSLLPPEHLRRGNDAAVWHLAEHGGDIESVVDSAGHAIKTEGMPWFARFEDPQEVLRTFQDDDENMYETWGFGRKGSPVRERFIAGAKRHLGVPTK
jgi:hypothetical protein